MSGHANSHSEGKWHDTLQQLRLQLRRGMDGETSSSQRRMGLEYGINFGVNLLRLHEMAKALPQEQELADLMWGKEVREMKLLSLMIRPTDTLDHATALTLSDEVETLEVAEQLAFLLLKRVPFAPQLLAELFERRYPAATPQATLPYLLLNHMAGDERLSAPLFSSFETDIIADFTAPNFYNGSVIFHALLKVASLRGAELPIEPICQVTIACGNEQSKALATQLLEINRETDVAQ